jgi:methylglutaconyl-CoA hydratase
MGKAVLVSTLENGIVLITLNRPEAANSLSLQMLEELEEAVVACKFDRSVRCVVITGAGEKAF